jgi:uncharacterized protein (UPF0262 family)
MTGNSDRNRLIEVKLDDQSIGRAPPDVEHERAVAIYDLIEENCFRPVGTAEGPYKLVLSLVENRLVFDVSTEADEPVVTHILSLTPFRKIVKDYFLICESYYEAIKTSSPSRIEAIDMGRRGIHNDGSKLLQERLEGKIEIDFDTARRLFTLVCVLHWRG